MEIGEEVARADKGGARRVGEDACDGRVQLGRVEALDDRSLHGGPEATRDLGGGRLKRGGRGLSDRAVDGGQHRPPVVGRETLAQRLAHALDRGGENPVPEVPREDLGDGVRQRGSAFLDLEVGARLERAAHERLGRLPDGRLHLGRSEDLFEAFAILRVLERPERLVHDDRHGRARGRANGARASGGSHHGRSGEHEERERSRS